MRWSRSLAVAVAACAVIPCWAASAVAASAANAGQARVRLISTLTMGPDLDFYVDGQKVVSKVAYKNVTTYLNVAPGDHSFQVRKAGDAAPIADLRQTVGADSFSTVVAIEDMDMTTKELFFADGITAPAAGGAVMRFLHVCEQIPTVSLGPAGGPAIISNIGFKQSSPYVPVQAGTSTLQLRQADKPDNVVFEAKDFVLQAGAIRTFLGIGGMGEPVEMLSVLDAASAGTAPQGAAATGAGGLVYGRALGLGILTCTLLLAGGLLVAAVRAPRAD